MLDVKPEMKKEIGQRESDVLRAVVEGYVEDAAPVGSRTLSRSRLSSLGLSPATIRNTMADLEEQGYIIQPHPSAGRVPTDRGYRLFVDEIMRSKLLSRKNMDMIDRSLEKELEHSANVGDVKETVLRLLSRLSKKAGIMIYPKVSAAVISRFHFIRISNCHLQVILITATGLVQNLFIKLDDDSSEDELLELTNFVNAQYAGNTLRQVYKRLKRKVKSERARMERLRTRALKIQEKLLSQQEGIDIIIEGTATFLDAPEFRNNAEKLKNLFKALSDKERILKILVSCMDAGQMKINIGSEISTEGLEDCSFLVCTGTEWEGTLGVVGPRRMDYPYMCSLLEYLSGAINRIAIAE